MDVRIVETPIHGRYLFEPRSPERLLAGFHGYAENAERHLAEIRLIPGIGEWSVAAVQALRTFYAGRSGDVVASWMTSQDRELAIADNLRYIRTVLGALPQPRHLVFLGFSQGVAMAYRAAAHMRCSGLIVLGGDMPPQIDEQATLPPILIGRGRTDEWFTVEKMERDVRRLKSMTDVATCEFEGAHEWSEAFRNAVGEFLSRFS